MQLVDSHCHLDQLDLTPYEGNLAKALSYANEFDVQHFLCVCITLDHFVDVLNIAKKYANVYASVGLHPNEVVAIEPDAGMLVKLASNEKVIAIGETGLDYYRSEGDLEWQRDRFRQHVRAAKQTEKPLIIHSRQARQDTLQILREEDGSSIGGVMHCFTEDWEMARAAIELNFYISFSGIITFKNAKEVQAVAKKIPLDRMLIETDSPYLAPNPYRGKSNQPAYVRFVAEFIAKLRGVDVQVIAEHTTENFFKLFGKAHV